MNLHLDKKLFKDFIDNLNVKTGISTDIIEKDYYVCAVLQKLSQKQSELQAYFKGGTAIYKILGTMNRFSEDIDLTVKIIKNQSNTKNYNRLKNSALSYKIEGLILSKKDCIDKKGSITGIYKYNSIYEPTANPLHREGIIQVEATSFTVSEPYQKYLIEPLIYKLSNQYEKSILEKQFNISSFFINIIKIERMFIDKIFAAEFYYIRNMLHDTSKHLYDICVLLQNETIKKLLSNKKELIKLINYKRQEELLRFGGITANTKIKNFNYFKLDFNNNFIQEFYNMQNKYLLNKKYTITISELKEDLSKLLNVFMFLSWIFCLKKI